MGPLRTCGTLVLYAQVIYDHYSASVNHCRMRVLCVACRRRTGIVIEWCQPGRSVDRFQNRIALDMSVWPGIDSESCALLGCFVCLLGGAVGNCESDSKGVAQCQDTADAGVLDFALFELVDPRAA